MSDTQDQKQPKSAQESEALAHLKDQRAKNLRDNLAKRKAQIRARAQADGDKAEE